jgi:hypothetical protein
MASNIDVTNSIGLNDDSNITHSIIKEAQLDVVWLAVFFNHVLICQHCKILNNQFRTNSSQLHADGWPNLSNYTLQPTQLIVQQEIRMFELISGISPRGLLS